ncbi:MAG: 3-isopropylmalate dehydratase [Chloroflexi bacterium]|nr:3-isopropylmalate dehydratase [Chloroflexota bacterium]
MTTKLKGRAWTFGDVMDVDWEICPFEIFQQFIAKGKMPTPEDLGQYCMTTVDPNFPKKVKKGDFIVAGETFGYGHDHDHACKAIKGAGVAAVICDSTSGNFFRMSLEHGLPVVQYPGIRKLTAEGDEIELDLAGGVIRNMTKGKEYHFIPYPSFLLEMIEAGGLYPRLKQRAAAGKL